jgi:YfiH family protein
METIIEPSAVSEHLSTADDETLSKSGFYWRERSGVKVLVCRPLEETGFANGFSTRLGGVSSLEADPAGSELNLGGFNEDSRENIYENRRRFFAALDRPYKLATAWQVHGDNIRVVSEEADLGDSNERADALVSDLKSVFVGVKTADCVPVLLADPSTGAFASVHAGWRGTAQSIVQKAVARMEELFGSKPAVLICAIGPAAACERYEVGSEVIDMFHQNFAPAAKYFVETRPGHALVDLKLANRDQLIDVGVDAANIYTAPFCTMTRTDLFFSYRIEKARFGRTGRLLSVIGRH